MPNDFRKQVPFSIEAEQSVLGAILIDPEKFKDVAVTLREDDFYIEEYRNIYSAMLTLSLDQNRTIDVVTLINALVETGKYDEASCRQSIKTIVDVVPSAANLSDYVSIVKNKSMLRSLISASEEISEAAYSEQSSVESILDMAEQKIFGVADINSEKGLVHIKELLFETHTHLTELSRNPEQFKGAQTYFSGLDNVLVGMNKGDLIIVGARPGMGKTSFCLNVAQNAAYKGKKTVCIFSLEMTGEQIVSRMLSTEACIPSTTLRSGNLSDDDWNKLGHAASKLAECDIYIDSSGDVTVSQIKAKLRRIKNLGLVVIDYLQLMHDNKFKDNRVQEVSEISRGLKLMANELKVPVICCSQLNRALEKTKEKIPTLADLRESGSIEQDADVVILLYRPEYYDQNQEQQNRAQVIVAKNRHGEQKTVEMAWDGQYTKFTELSPIEEPSG